MVRKAEEKDKVELKKLWIETFNDSEEFFDDFYKHRFSSSIVYLLEDDRELISAAWYIKSKYYLDEEIKDCFFVVGVATKEEYRKQGHMKTLLEEANLNATSPVFLYPAVRPYYEKLGFTSGHAFLFDIPSHDVPEFKYSEFDINKLNEIYTASIKRCNGLIRDEYAWSEISNDYHVLIEEEAYMLVSKETGRIEEATALDKHSALVIYPYLYGKVTVLPHSPLEKLLVKKEESHTKILLGMSNNGENIYIKEQY